MKITRRQLRRIIKEEALNEFLGFGGPSKKMLETLDNLLLPEFGKYTVSVVRNIGNGDYDRKDGGDMLLAFKADHVDKALKMVKQEDIMALIKKGKKPGKKLQKFFENIKSFGAALEDAAGVLKKSPGDAAGKTQEAFGWVEEYFPGGLTKDSKIMKAKELLENRSRVTSGRLRRIIREERVSLLREQAPPQSAGDTSDNNSHHWPRVDWNDVEELADKWADQELKAFDKGDPSQNPDDMSLADAKKWWTDQVEAAAMDMEAELVTRVRKVALQTMQEFTDNLINGDYS